MGLLFEWEAGKARTNLRKHQVSFDHAATVFGDPLSLTIPDPVHSEDEARFLTLGRSASGTMLVVAHTDRADRVRLISARKAAPREIREYERKQEI